MTDAHEKKEPALRLIILYKLVKGSVSLCVALLLYAAIVFHFEHELHDLAAAFHEHVTHAWALRVAELIVNAADRKHLLIAAVALTFDGTLTLVEGVGLQRGWWWAPWLVVAATSVFLPFEVVSLVHHIAIGRVLVFLANLAIVLYLARRTLEEHRRRHPRVA
jgi:uncharacterized membrane protein (DUF2068 family)